MKTARSTIKKVVHMGRNKNKDSKDENMSHSGHKMKKKFGFSFRKLSSRNKEAVSSSTEPTSLTDEETRHPEKIEFEGLEMIKNNTIATDLSLSQPNPGITFNLEIHATGMHKQSTTSSVMPANAFYEIEDQAGEVVARSCLLTDMNPSWPSLELEVPDGNSKISLVFYDYDQKTRQSLELACIETHLDELLLAVAAHKRHPEQSSYSLAISGIEVYICKVEIIEQNSGDQFFANESKNNSCW
eukprot:CAMPEP_0178903278 /NCGR_PEP_ID=MMETSP0786-20121207/5071_1 /TAXON_ID=186022 /ORGANISM="Thalassionema frauenfeldii, Strain CCMP 1798" /LENGTH=242 /DNA_ID=CAMNT_0020574637 /DNA_START=8 /DNA_END=733 /DNA_ORIENTATION=+